jgi:hypothetical protein
MGYKVDVVAPVAVDSIFSGCAYRLVNVNLCVARVEGPTSRVCDLESILMV